MRSRWIEWAYLVSDGLAAGFAWAAFYVFRKLYLEREAGNWHEWIDDRNFIYGVLLLPIAWLLFYAVWDSYRRSVYRMFRLGELLRTLVTSILGCLGLFFLLVLDDMRYYADTGYRSYYYAFWALLLLHFGTTAFFRMLWLSIARWQIRHGKVRFRTLLVGARDMALEVFQDSNPAQTGYQWRGFLTVGDKGNNPQLAALLPCLGKANDLDKAIEEQQIEEVILAFEKSERRHLNNLLHTLEKHRHRLVIKVAPDMYDILLGKAQMQHPYGTALVEIEPHLIPTWFRFIKRSIDIIGSGLFLLLFAPVYAFVAWRVRRSSPGTIFYRQERMGRYGKPFMIYKFRSMYTDAEKSGPKLSTDNDDRCTPWGRTMRKYRLDEIPQFWNVLKGDMSLVGPRPERRFYLDQIAEKAPHVYQLLKVRPGITSWGQVKFGYASSVDEMVQRLKYDILYIESISLILDIKILLYTVLVIIQGRGK